MMNTTNTTKTALISVFLNTWGNYNENGADGGFWVELPCDLDEVLDRLAERTGEDRDEMEVFINDADIYINGLEVGEYDDIEELNDLAEDLEALDSYDLEKVEAILEAHGGSLRDALDNIDDYTFYQGMTLEDLTYDFVEEMNLSEFAQRYFDYEAFARDLGFDGYTETENGVIC